MCLIPFDDLAAVVSSSVDGLAVQTAAFVRGRQVRQQMCSLKLVSFAKFHFHSNFRIAFPNRSR